MEKKKLVAILMFQTILFLEAIKVLFSAATKYDLFNWHTIAAFIGTAIFGFLLIMLIREAIKQKKIS